jgi:hypothetical protein
MVLVEPLEPALIPLLIFAGWTSLTIDACQFEPSSPYGSEIIEAVRKKAKRHAPSSNLRLVIDDAACDDLSAGDLVRHKTPQDNAMLGLSLWHLFTT